MAKYTTVNTLIRAENRLLTLQDALWRAFAEAEGEAQDEAEALYDAAHEALEGVIRGRRDVQLDIEVETIMAENKKRKA